MLNIKMIDSKQFRKFVYKFLEIWPIISRDTLNLLRDIIFWTAATVGFQLLILGLPSLMLSQVIIFIAGILVTILKVTHLESILMEIWNQILIFLIYEMAIISTITLNATSIWNIFSMMRMDDDFIVAIIAVGLDFGFLFLVLVMNTITHSILVYHLIRETEYTVPKYTGAIRAFCCFIGLILVYGLMLLTFGLSTKKMTVAPILVLLVQATVAIIVQGTASGLKWGQEAEAMKKWLNLSTYFSYVVVLLPIVISVVIIATKYGIAVTLKEVEVFAKDEVAFLSNLSKQPDSIEFEFVSRSFSFGSCICLSFMRYYYLKDTIENLAEPEYLEDNIEDLAEPEYLDYSTATAA